jgi:hypothetical protein
MLERQRTDPHESMAYLARSLTHAVGAEGRTRGVLGKRKGIDLNADFGFTRDRAEHSAQFNRPIQRGLVGFYELFWCVALTPSEAP